VGELGGGQVTFESYPSSGAASRDWVGIRFEETSLHSVLKNTRIKDAELAIENYAPIQLYGCTVDNTNRRSIALHANAIVNNSTIYITCDTKIEAGDTLGLAGDSKIYVSPVDSFNTLYDPQKVEFLSNGRLVVNGQSNHPVQFTSYSSSPSAGDWRGLEISGSSASAQLAYCNLSFGYHGIKATRPIQLSHSTISDCQVYGIYLQNSGVNGAHVSYCTSGDNGCAGMMVSMCSNVTVDHSEFDENYYGIDVDGVSALYVKHSNMKNNAGDGLEAINSACYVDTCIVESNGQQGIYMPYSWGWIQGTKIWKNDANGLYCYGSSSTPRVAQSKIEQNEVGVHVAAGACPVLGDEDLDCGQYNSIYDQPTFVYGSPYYTIMAENCWWGTQQGESPNPLKFKGLVDYSPFLQQDPVLYLAQNMRAEPTMLSLSQNYPNPFVRAGGTTISYSIPSSHSAVALTIYDVAGRKVRTLVGNIQGRGRYSVNWDGRTDFGAKVAAGVYFCRLTVNGTSRSKKLLLVR